jgi:hypothetical protein
MAARQKTHICTACNKSLRAHEVFRHLTPECKERKVSFQGNPSSASWIIDRFSSGLAAHEALGVLLDQEIRWREIRLDLEQQMERCQAMTIARYMDDLTDHEVANKVALLMRTDLNHEAVLLCAKDRIRKLSAELKAAREEIHALKMAEFRRSCAVAAPIANDPGF